MLSFHSGKIDFVHRAPICIYRHTANFTIFQGMRLNNFRTKVSNCMHETYSMASLIRCHSTGREYMSDFFCVPSRCLLVKGGRGIGKTKTGGEMRSRRSTSTSAVCFFFSLASHCLLFEWQYAQFGPLYLCFTQTYTQTALPPTRRRRHTYIQMRTSLLFLPPLKALGAACLPFTVTALCACVCVVCVCRSEEGDIACQVLSRAKLSFLSVITPSYFPGAGCLSFCLSLYNTHTPTHSLSLSLTHSLTHTHTRRRSSRQC